MADISIKDLENLNEALKSSALGQYIENLKDAGQQMVSFSDLSKTVGETVTTQIKGMIDSAKGLVDAFGSMLPVVEQVQAAGSALWAEMTSSTENYITSQDYAAEGAVVMGAQIALALEPVIGLIPEGITGMGNLGDAGFSAGSKISDAFDGISPLLTKIFGDNSKVVNYFEGVSNGATAAFGLQREIANLAATQGVFNTVLDDSGSSFVEMSDLYLNHINMTYESAKATGQTVSSMMDLSKALAPIPDALSEPIQTSIGSMNQLTAVSRIATGFMRDQSEVAAHLGNMYTNMGIKGGDALGNLSNLYEKAGDSKLRFETFTNTVLGIAGSFKMLGDNTAAATNIVKSFDDVFKDSDISPAAMSDLIGRMSQGIERMDMAKMAFVSSTTGGPGGIAGSLEMELAVREGRMDEVLNKTMQAMQSQFGGQVLTLEDAAGNEQLAAEFVKQREYLKQVAGIAGSDAEANRILEAMKSGVMDGLTVGREETETTEDRAFENAIDRGTEEQMRTNSLLMTIHQDLEMSRLVQSDIFAGVSQSMAESELGQADRMRLGAGTSGKTASINTDVNQSFVGLDREALIAQYTGDLASTPIVGEFIAGMKDVVASKGSLMGAMETVGAAPASPDNMENVRFPPVTLDSRGAETESSLIKSLMTDREVTGTTPQMFGSGRELPLPDGAYRAPMKLEDYANAPFGLPEGEGGSSKMQELEISYKPLEVKVSFDKPFEDQVRLIAADEVSRSRQGQVRAGANGRPM